MKRYEGHEIIIKPHKTNFYLDISEVWRYRELFYIFAWRDIKVRYKQTLFGITWVIMQPFVSMIIFTIFFGNLAKIPSGKLPYPLFVLCGLVFWTFFSTALSSASASLTSSENIIKKVYFPKVILPVSTIVTASVDLLINISLLFIVSLYFLYIPPLATIPIMIIGYLITSLTATGLGLFFSALNVKYHDVRFILPFFIQILLFLTPVIYPTSLLKSVSKIIFAINPMTGVIESLRAVISGNMNIDYLILSISALASIIIFLLGLGYFNATEKLIADII